MTRPNDPKVATLPPPRWLRSVATSLYPDAGWLEVERERVFGRTWTGHCLAALFQRKARCDQAA